MEQMLLVMNADAGTADRDSVDAALSVLRDTCEVEVAKSHDLEELDRILRDSGDRTIVVAGGDGSLHATVEALHRRDQLADRTLALLPLGTGNDFARALNLPLDPKEAAQVILDGQLRPIDLIVEDSGEVVVNSVHAGAGTQASKIGASWKSRLAPVGLGRLGYPIGAALTALNPRGIRLRIEADGDVLTGPDRRVLMVVIGNGSSVGGGAELTPDADPSDGYADVVVAVANGPVARLGLALGFGLGDLSARSDVITRRVKEVSVRGRAFSVTADGEIDEPREARTWRVLPAAYQMLVPLG